MREWQFAFWPFPYCWIKEQAWTLHLSLLGFCTSTLVASSFQGTFGMEGPASCSADTSWLVPLTSRGRVWPQVVWAYPISATPEVGSPLPLNSVRARDSVGHSCRFKGSDFQWEYPGTWMYDSGVVVSEMSIFKLRKIFPVIAIPFPEVLWC